MRLRYILAGRSLILDSGRCVGCGLCVDVCPHAVFAVDVGKAAVVDREACMECGACMRNCPAGAIEVRTGEGCAASVIKGLLTGKPGCGCDGDSGCC
ncbi:MAG: ferredoxin [Spirochaetae bacterium HGW-Spirochaetae-7]|jgi:NAD-dependent dihydropyrimidine dehydrogenase PreA subunit|nr:MAG: ferredoxin [Spirochaetae bacterium HGW-Spirochaetae-7]